MLKGRLSSVAAWLGIGALLLLAGCARRDAADSPLVVWTGWQNEGRALAALAGEFSARSGVPVRVVSIPFSDLKNKFQLAAPAYVGPDLLTGPHDWVGPFATAGLVASLADEELFRDSLPIGRTSMEFRERTFGVPLLMEGLALLYNRDLVSAPPATMGEIVARLPEFRARGGYPLVAGITDFYFAWPFFGGWGAAVFRPGTADRLEPEPALADPPALAAARYLRELIQRDHLFPATMTGDVANGLFLERKAGMIVNGPWFLEDIRKAGIRFGVARFPAHPNGKRPRPFVGVQGVFLNRRSSRMRDALTFLRYLGAPAAGVALARASGRIPVNRLALDELRDPSGDQEAVAGFSAVLGGGMVLPNTPAMTQVWPHMEEAMKLLLRSDHEVEVIMRTSVKNIAAAVRRLVR